MSDAVVQSDVPKISTNVRFIERATKAAVRLAFRIAPRQAERWTARQFCTPKRKGSGREPAIAGHLGERRVRTVRNYDVVSWTWGSGPEVLLVHGWAGRATQFETIAARLLSLGYRVTAVDLPAHGASSGRTTTVAHFVEAVRAVAKERPRLHAVVAHSMGATATAIALVDGLQAQKAVLLAPAMDPRHFVREVAAFLGVPELHVQGMEHAIEQLAARDLNELDLGRREGALELPLLVLHDPTDRDVPIAHGEGVARVSRRGVFERLNGLGHRRLLRDPGVAERISEFIRLDGEALERKVQ